MSREFAILPSPTHIAVPINTNPINTHLKSYFTAKIFTKTEAAKLTTTFVFATLSAVLYWHTTKKEGFYTIFSSITANVLSGIGMNYASTDYLCNLITSHRYLKATALSTLSAILYSPQIILALMKSNGLISGIFSGIATGFAGIGIFTYALIDLVENIYPEAKFGSRKLYFKLRDKFNLIEDTEREIFLFRLSLLKKLDMLSEYHRYDGALFINLPPHLKSEELINYAKHLEEFVDEYLLPSSSNQFLSFLYNSFLFLLKPLTILPMVYGSTGYLCNTAQALKNTFHLYIWAATIGAYIMMGCQLLLNVVCAFLLATHIPENIISSFKYKKLPEEFKLGGMMGRIATFLSPMVAILMGMGSGFTAASLYTNTCPTSLLKFLMFNGGQQLINIFTVIFNTYYTWKFFNRAMQYIIDYKGNDQDRQYFAARKILEDVKKAIQNASNEKIKPLISPRLFSSINDDKSPASPTNYNTFDRTVL